MSWQGILGHDAIVEQFRRSLSQGRLATTFLFVGPPGIGKRTFATRLAQSMLCSRVPEQELAACGECEACQQVLADSHPDLQLIQKPADRAFIPVDTFIGDRDHRMRSGLCHFISLTPSGGKRRIAIIDDADWLNQEGANSLLKTLEEPSPGAVIILISSSLQRQLPTIRSRSQVVRFHPLSTADVETCLIQQGVDPEQAAEMAARSGGSLADAMQRSDPAEREFCLQLWSALSDATIHRADLAKCVASFVEEGAKDTPAKRERLRRVLHATIEFYRAAVRARCGGDAPHDSAMEPHLQHLTSRPTSNAEALASLIERSVDALRQTGSNANLPMLIDAWVCDLARISRSGQPLLNSIRD